LWIAAVPRVQRRPQLSAASSDDSDWYEETLVNPTLLTLTTQRGNIDCGGLRYVLVGYGNFTQLVLPTGGTGHLSIAFELGRQPTAPSGGDRPAHQLIRAGTIACATLRRQPALTRATTDSGRAVDLGRSRGVCHTRRHR
jgi:hypothetical protein